MKIHSELEDLAKTSDSQREKMNDYELEMKTIVDFVEDYRKKHNIVPIRGRKIEMSGIAFGEGYNLLYCQLILTNNDYSWSELEDLDVRKLVLDQIKKDSSKNKL